MVQTMHPSLRVIGSAYIERWLDSNPERALQLVRLAYLAHAQGKTVNPDSYFLRFPDSEKNRIIALPASLEDERPVAGIKWIASFPDNPTRGIDRASAVLILNDRMSGYPFACLEGSAISAARTAASAAVGAHYLHSSPGQIRQLGIIGCGPIAFRTVTLLIKLGWRIGSLCLHDLAQERAVLFEQKCAPFDLPCTVGSAQETVATSDMLLFATSAVRPTIDSESWFAHAPTVLHMSLRDLAPNIVLASQNVADDVEHCLKANTSLDLSRRLYGHTRFIDGDIAAVIEGRVVPDVRRTRIFSPFGMGVLDLTMAREIVATMSEAESAATTVPDFFPEPYQAHATAATSAIGHAAP